MTKKIENLFDKIKNGGKTRTLKLALFLSLLVTIPLILSEPQKHLNMQQYAQVVPAGVIPVYGIHANVLDNLANNWTAGIKYGGPTAYDLYNQAPVYNGTNSIAYTITAPWDELTLTSPQAIDISSYTYLTFYVQAGGPGMRFGIHLLDAGGQPVPPTSDTTTSGVPMEQYGGVPVTTAWYVYNIPISAFSVPGNSITGIIFKDINGGTQGNPPPPIYIDEINFSTVPGEDLPPPAGAIQISPPTAYPTPTMPYYPNISPWVFIIPGIIIVLAVIFQ